MKQKEDTASQADLHDPIHQHGQSIQTTTAQSIIDSRSASPFLIVPPLLAKPNSNYLARVPPAPKKIRCSSNDSVLFDNNIDFRSASNNQNYNSLRTSVDPQLAPVENRLNVKRRYSKRQKDINKMISRICEERLFSVLVKEAADSGIISKPQASHYLMKEHYLNNHRGQAFLLNDTDLLQKLNLNSNYNTISNYAKTNRELKPDINMSSLTIDPAAAAISNKHQRIKNFFSGIHPAQLKMNVLPPLNPVTTAFRQAFIARSPKKRTSINGTKDVDLSQMTSSEKASNARHKLQKQKISHSFHINESARKRHTEENHKDPKEVFIEDLEKIFTSNTMMPLHVYETDMDQFKSRIVPTPFKESFMPKHFRDRIIALNVKF